MKKSTKQKIVVIFIMLIFGMSSIAFVFLNISGTGNTNAETKQLASPVIDEELDPQTESLYLQNGITFLRYYYTDKDELFDYVSGLPNTLTTANGQVQLVVERIDGSERKVSISSLYGGNGDLDSVTQESIFSSLCNHLISTPPECALRAINSSLSG
ncbi:MAG: hypothetical protein QMD85_04500 [Candidatus Aenigmarchaeota archaeon]|nr:hypothetical protein [Candidatus Aenigmarchaeota archaeon]MDI6722831.1 hypothetical protein [Candidatus Aenigmarchaeota archaeon]